MTVDEVLNKLWAVKQTPRDQLKVLAEAKAEWEKAQRERCAEARDNNG
jgi:hypothetical protein